MSGFVTFDFSYDSRVLCKFFAHGACLKGEHCEFSHHWKHPPNNICTYYQKGNCFYGSRCRYEHVKASQPDPSASSSSTAPDSVPLLPSKTAFVGSIVSSDASTKFPDSSRASVAPSQPEGNLESAPQDLSDNGETVGPRSDNPVERPICSFAAAGNCPRGEKCPHLHGDLCSTCEKHCLHPFRPEEREEHIKMCKKKQKYLDALKLSQEIECSVCLDRVLSKPTSAERKFGILSECNHPFCVTCIRNWRSSSPSSGMDVNTALRACPICRKLSYFVIPSVIWFWSPEEKQQIVDGYKAKLRSINCKHFNFGNGNCPFGNSCFYKHAYRNGQLEEVALRHLGEDGRTIITKNIRIVDKRNQAWNHGGVRGSAIFLSYNDGWINIIYDEGKEWE
ncbi:hypothetical protein GQ457_11G019890 [Hibiscus cannabinus]